MLQLESICKGSQAVALLEIKAPLLNMLEEEQCYTAWDPLQSFPGSRIASLC